MLAVAVPQRLVRLVVIVLEARLVRLIHVTALGLRTLHVVSVRPTVAPMSTSALKVTSSVALTVAQGLFLPPSSSGLFLMLPLSLALFLSATSSSALSHAVFPWLPLSQARPFSGSFFPHLLRGRCQNTSSAWPKPHTWHCGHICMPLILVQNNGEVLLAAYY